MKYLVYAACRWAVAAGCLLSFAAMPSHGARAPWALPATVAVGQADSVDEIAGAPAADTSSRATGGAGLTADKINRLKAASSNEELLIDEEEIAGGPRDTAAAAPAAARDTAVAPRRAESPTPAADSTRRAAVPPPAAPVTASAPATAAPPPAGAATIERPGQINFAENLKNYRSPKLAMLLSAIIPGLGQAYVKEYWQTGVFVAVEAAIIGASLFQVKKGADQFTHAKQFAVDNYDTLKFVDFYNTLVQGVWRYFAASNDTFTIDSARAKVNRDIFYLESPLDTMRRQYSRRGSNSSFYSTITRNEFLQGWDGCMPPLSADAQQQKWLNELQTGSTAIDSNFMTSGDTVYITSISTLTGEDSLPIKFDRIIAGKTPSLKNDTKKFGYSAKYDKYEDMLAAKDAYYSTARNILFALLVNHIVSAIDAGIMAKAYNDRQLGKESFWQHIRLEGLLASDGRGGWQPGCGMQIRF